MMILMEQLVIGCISTCYHAYNYLPAQDSELVSFGFLVIYAAWNLNYVPPIYATFIYIYSISIMKTYKIYSFYKI
jgi:hypothetical protein